MIRRLSLLAVTCVAVSLTACGGVATPSETEAPPGSPENPLVAEVPDGATDEGGAGGKGQTPGYEKLVDGQSKQPQARFTPCNLVTERQAAAIVGPIEEPVEAAQGPTCVYRGRNGGSFVTVAVQQVDFSQLRRSIVRPQRVDVESHTAYCGTHGQPVLYLPLSGGRVLSIAGQCEVAKRFAAKALPQIPG